tara:strand:+ start:479 stop:625 length:147 start_codon:yes stop_codon:yes gene_type:complete
LEQSAVLDGGNEIEDGEIKLGGDFSLSDEDLDALMSETNLEKGDPDTA